jgi:hypothetical protein
VLGLGLNGSFWKSSLKSSWGSGDASSIELGALLGSSLEDLDWENSLESP